MKGFTVPNAVIIGAVGRMQDVKDPLNLVHAFIQLSQRNHRLRLIMIGDGPLRRDALEMLEVAGLSHYAWLPGSRNDIADILRCMDIFILPSRAEGISNTILEAMASALPVVATQVGGNGELVLDNTTGLLVPASDPTALADAIESYLLDPDLRQCHGRAGRERVEQFFSIDVMIKKYVQLYDTLLER